MYNPTVFYRAATRQAFRMQSRKGLQNSINSFLSANNFNPAYVHSWCWKNQISKEFFRDFSNDKRKNTHTRKKQWKRSATLIWRCLPAKKTSRPLQPQTCNEQALTISPFNYPSSSLGPKSNLVISYIEKLQGPMARTHLLNVKSPSI